MTPVQGESNRVRLAFLMEVVTALAVGAALARDPISPTIHVINGFESSHLGKALEFIKAEHAAAAGIALVIGLGTWYEAARGKSPRPWGPGRWVWSSIAAYIIVQHVALGADHVLQRYQIQDEVGWIGDLFGGLQAIRVGTTPQCALILLSLWSTSLVARLPLGPANDARERAGRWFACFLMTTLLTDRLLTTLCRRIFKSDWP